MSWTLALTAASPCKASSKVPLLTTHILPFTPSLRTAALLWIPSPSSLLPLLSHPFSASTLNQRAGAQILQWSLSQTLSPGWASFMHRWPIPGPVPAADPFLPCCPQDLPPTLDSLVRVLFISWRNGASHLQLGRAVSPCLSGHSRPSFLLLPVNDVVCAAAFSSACLSLSSPSTPSASAALGLDSWATSLS